MLKIQIEGNEHIRSLNESWYSTSNLKIWSVRIPSVGLMVLTSKVEKFKLIMFSFNNSQKHLLFHSLSDYVSGYKCQCILLWFLCCTFLCSSVSTTFMLYFFWYSIWKQSTKNRLNISVCAPKAVTYCLSWWSILRSMEQFPRSIDPMWQLTGVALKVADDLFPGRTLNILLISPLFNALKKTSQTFYLYHNMQIPNIATVSRHHFSSLMTLSDEKREKKNISGE